MSKDKKEAEELLFQELLKEGLAIQDRFAAKPVFGSTGTGFLKSSGVKELAEIKTQRERKGNGTD